MTELNEAIRRSIEKAYSLGLAEGMRLGGVKPMDGACADSGCTGACGYGHLDGCAAIREYLSDNGGETFKGAPSPERATLRRQLAEARAQVAALRKELSAQATVSSFGGLRRLAKAVAASGKENRKLRVEMGLDKPEPEEEGDDRGEPMCAMGCSGSCGGAGCPACGGRR